VSDDKNDHNSALHLLEAFPLSVISDVSFTATKSPQSGTHEWELSVSSGCISLTGWCLDQPRRFFVKVTYDTHSDHFSWDNTDIRYANKGRPVIWKAYRLGDHAEQQSHRRRPLERHARVGVSLYGQHSTLLA